MALLKISSNEKRALAAATIAGAIVSIWFLKHYLMLIVLSALFAFLFNPVYQWLVKRGRNRGQAALLTFLASLLSIIVPVLIIGLITVVQIGALTHNLSTQDYSASLTQLGNEIVNSINDLLHSVGSSYTLTTAELSKAISTAANSVSQAIVAGLISSISGIFSLIATAIIYIYVFMSMLRHQDKIISTARKLNPLGDQASNLYLERIGSMTKATVRGQFIIAFLQGLESAIVLTLVGFNELFFFFLMLLTALSVIPLGAGIVTIPLGIAMILTGRIWQGALVIANHLLVVTNIDNVTRPKLVPANARLDPALMILAVFSGLFYFGFVGIVIGPVIMIVLITTLQMYLEVYKNTESLGGASAGQQGSVLGKVRKLIKR